MTERNPDDVRARWLELQASATPMDLRRNREAAVATVVWMELASEDHRPEPYWQQQSGRRPRRRLDGPSDDATRVGLDALGRPVLAEHILGGQVWSRDLLTWADDRVELVGLQDDSVAELHVLWLDGARAVEEISCVGDMRLDGRPCVEVVSYRYDDAGRVDMAILVYESGSHHSWGPEKGPYWGSTATRFTHDATGALVLVEHLVGPDEISHGEGHEAALSAAFAGMEADPSPTHVVWDGRVAAREDDLPRPEQAYDGVVAALADAIFAAVERVRDRVGRLAFVVVDLASYSHSDDQPLVRAAAAGVGHRDRARHLVGDIQEVIDLAYEGGQDTARLDIIGAATPDLQRQLRAAAQTLEVHWEIRTRVTYSLATELASELNEREWHEADPTFVALVRAEDPDLHAGLDEARGWEHAESDETRWQEDEDGELTAEELAEADAAGITSRFGDDEQEEDLEPTPPLPARRLFHATSSAIGDERIDEFAAPLAPIGKPAVSNGDIRAPDRDALAALLRQAGLAHVEAQRVADDAAWGIILEQGEHLTTRLGGSPILPADVDWPMADDRPLTHLATIALAELPRVEGRELLPPDGHLSFFADLSQAGKFYEPIEPGAPQRDLVAIHYAPAGAATHEPSPPHSARDPEDDSPIVLQERRVQPTARLQIRHVGFGHAATRFGIDAVGEHVLERLTCAINGETPHQLFGFPPVVQDDPRGDGQVALFHIGDDPELGFSFIDAGDILFFGSPEDIRARRWDKLTAWPSSC